MTKSPRKNVPDVGIELGAACMLSGHASDRATAPGKMSLYHLQATDNEYVWKYRIEHVIEIIWKTNVNMPF